MNTSKQLFKLMYTNPDSLIFLENAYSSSKWQKKMKEGKVTTKLIEPLMEAIKLGKVNYTKKKLLLHGCTIENYNTQFEAALDKLSKTNNIPKEEIKDLLDKLKDEVPDLGSREDNKKSLTSLRFQKEYSLKQLPNDMEKDEWLDKVKSGEKTRPICFALQDAISQNFLRFLQEELLELGYPEDLLEKQIDEAVEKMAKNNEMAASDLWCLIDPQPL